MTHGLTHFLQAKSGMFFVHEKHELLFCDIRPECRGTTPSSVDEALGMTYGKDYLSDVTTTWDMSQAEIKQLMSWLTSLGEEALCRHVKGISCIYVHFLRTSNGLYLLDDSSHLMWGEIERELPDGAEPTSIEEALLLLENENALCDVSDLTEETPENIVKLIAWLRSHDEDVLCADVKAMSKKVKS